MVRGRTGTRTLRNVQGQYLIVELDKATDLGLQTRIVEVLENLRGRTTSGMLRERYIAAITT